MLAIKLNHFYCNSYCSWVLKKHRNENILTNLSQVDPTLHVTVLLESSWILSASLVLRSRDILVGAGVKVRLQLPAPTSP